MERSERVTPSPFVASIMRVSMHVLPDVHFLLRRELRDCTSVLDVGCGSEFSPISFVPRIPGQTRTGIDAFLPSIERARAAGIHDEYIHADAIEYAGFGESRGRFEAVVALDLIEHFEKPRSVELVEALEQLASKKVILLTPNGFLPQEPYDGNEFQRHLCGWTTDELEARGYRVNGAYGFKPLRGEYGRPTIRPGLLGEALAMASQPAVLRAPRHAFSLFAIKVVMKTAR